MIVSGRDNITYQETTWGQRVRCGDNTEIKCLVKGTIGCHLGNQKKETTSQETTFINILRILHSYQLKTGESVVPLFTLSAHSLCVISPLSPCSARPGKCSNYI